MAEAFYNALTGVADATSAGIDLANSVQGSELSLPPLVIEVMKEIGHDVSQQRRKHLTPQMVAGANIVISMVTDFPLPPYLRSSSKLVRWDDIPDAVRTNIEFHRKVRDLIRDKVVQLVAQQEK